MKNPDPIRQEEILCKTYVSCNDLYELYELSKPKIRILMDEIEQDIVESGKKLFPFYPKRVPLELVLKKLPLNTAAISRAAKRLKA